MIFSQDGLALIKSFESCRLEAYQDIGGVWTCGWGSTGFDIGPGTVWSHDQADFRLNATLAEKEKSVGALVPKNLTNNQFSACVCFVYNLGQGNFAKSTLLNCIKTYHLDDAANEFLRWCKVDGIEVPGLLRRREAERALFLKPDSGTYA